MWANQGIKHFLLAMGVQAVSARLGVRLDLLLLLRFPMQSSQTVPGCLHANSA